VEVWVILAVPAIAGVAVPAIAGAARTETATKAAEMVFNMGCPLQLKSRGCRSDGRVR
jgi:hypothetical protein